MSLHEKIFTSSGTWTCPAGVKRVTLIGCGGGGGGGGGYEITNGTNVWASGGSGGGGAMLRQVEVSVIPNSGYTITIGAGGTGGAATTTALTKATDGGDTLFYLTSTGGDPVLAQFYGAGAGYAGGGSAGSTIFRYHLGGKPVRMTGEEDQYSILWQLDTGGDQPNYIVRPEIEIQRGGFCVGTNDTSMGTCGWGGPAPHAFELDARGGSPGTDGTDSGTYRGGSGGAGGGMGAFGVAGEGNDGGNGGNANGAGTGANGTAGGDAQANTGSGGGGGGAPGCGSAARGSGGAGGDGSDGKLIIRWYT